MIRRIGEAPRPGQGYRLRQGAYAVLLQGHRVLVTHQAEPTPEYQLPGGGIDPGETPLRALHREVWEETGWTIGAPRRLGAFRRFAYMPEYDIGAGKLCTISRARPALRIGPPVEAGHTAVWMAVDEAAELLANAGDRHFLLEALRA